MSKPVKLKRPTVQLQPSRIRRDPVREEKKAEIVSHEREIWLGVFGVALFAICIAVVTVGFSVITGKDEGAAVAQVAPEQFGACDGRPDCIIDAGTLRIAGETVKIAGMEAPNIQSPRCDEEAQRGVQALDRLTQLVNSGKVTTAGDVREVDGLVRTKVLVDGRDLGTAMVSAGVARRPSSEATDWCPQ